MIEVWLKDLDFYKVLVEFVEKYFREGNMILEEYIDVISFCNKVEVVFEEIKMGVCLVF